MWLAVVFASVTVHELAHSLVARRFGIEVAEIDLLPIGGVSRLRSLPCDPSGTVRSATRRPPMTGAEHDHLRPVERRILRWVEIGLDDAEIARRFGRSQRWVAQVRYLADLDRPGPPDHPDTSGQPADRLRPLERRLLRWRRQGVRHEDLSRRFRRSPAFLARVEEYANYKLTMA